jgi:Uma2 family endonuclease
MVGVRLRRPRRAAKAPEYWIVDLTTDPIVVHRRPKGGVYASIERRRGDDLLQIAALPGITMTAASIFT